MAQKPADAARALILAGKAEEAEAVLRKAEDSWTRIHLADLLVLRSPFDRERVEEAIGLYERAMRDFPELARASIDRARAMLSAAPDPLVEKLRDEFGHATFRPGQRDVIQALLKGRHAFAVMPAGAGKSLLYELPSLLLADPTIVVLPRAADPDFEGFRAGTVRRISVSAERFTSPGFAQQLGQKKIGLVAIEDAHCVSEWSHDFRPEYARLRDVLGQIRPGTLLAVTSTATVQVRSEIVERLGLQNPSVYVAPLDRPNLFLAVHRVADRIGQIASALRELSGPAVVHVLRRSDAEDVAASLRTAGIPAAAWPVAMEDWRTGRLRVIVAAGRVSDRPDVRGVFHYQYPASLEAYFDQATRAGLDGQPAKCAIYFDPEDKNFHRRGLDQEFPSREMLSYVHGMVKEGRTQAEILAFGGGSAAEVHQVALNVLEKYNTIRRSEPGRYEIVPDAPPIARVDLSEVERRRRQCEERLRAIENYLDGRACRRRAILEYFGEKLPSGWSCSGCDRCRSVTSEETTRRTPEARQAILDSVRELEPKRMTLNQMARAILFLGKPLKGLTETDVREVLHALVREGAIEVVPQGQWLKAKRR